MTPPQRPRIGIVGLGTFGSWHASHIADLDAELVGGMDIAPDARERFAAEFGVDTYADVADLYSAADAVIVTTPNRFHEEYVVGALEAGLDVLVEKPLAHTLESAERIVRAAHDAEGFCMVGFNNRLGNAVQVVKGYQRAGRFGELTHLEANYVRQRGIPGRGSWFTRKDVAGGGALIDIGVHAIDLALYVLDFPEVVEVSGVTRSEFGGRDDYAFIEMWGEDGGSEGFDVDDSASAFIRCADGRTVSLEVAWATNRPTTDEFYVRGTDAGARFDRATQELTLYESGVDGASHLVESDVETPESNTYETEKALFLEGVRAGEHPGTNTVEEALAVQRVVDAVYRSSETGRTVTLQETETPVLRGD
jgi:predicted dehydrogenase